MKEQRVNRTEESSDASVESNEKILMNDEAANSNLPDWKEKMLKKKQALKDMKERSQLPLIVLEDCSDTNKPITRFKDESPLAKSLPGKHETHPIKKNLTMLKNPIQKKKTRKKKLKKTRKVKKQKLN